MPKYIDKFLSFMNINDDDDVPDDEYLDDDDYDDEYEEEDEMPRRRIRRASRNNSSSRSSSNDDFDEEVPRSLSQSEKQVKPRTSASPSASVSSSSKVSPIRTTKRAVPMEVCVIKPKMFDEVREVTEALLDECTVILNLEGLEMSLIRRITDFSCGSCYALHAKVQQINDFILIIAPSSVDISGDFQEIQGENFEEISYGTRY